MTLLALGLTPPAVVAQPVDKGALAGNVVAAFDKQPLKGATVELSPVAGGRRTRRTVKADGQFQFEVPAGSYRLQVTLPGFMAYEQDVSIAAGETLAQDVPLDVGTLAWTLHVQPQDGERPVDKRTTTERVDVARRQGTRDRLLAPEVMRMVHPVYPSELHRQRVTGEVRLVGVLNAAGAVTHLRVVSAAHDELATRAIDAASQWLFDPTRLSGAPVPVRITFRYIFGS